jgi:hypothetical protein
MFERLDSSGKNVTAFGSIYAQTAKDFGLTQLSSRFVLGADGWYFAAENEIEHTAMAGRIAFQAETGALVSGVADNNIGGDVSGELTGGRGELTAPSDKTGRGTGTYSVETTRGEVSFDFAYYVIDGGDFIFISTDTAQAGNFLLTGRALTAAAPGASLNGGYSAQMDGVAVAGAPYFRSLLGQHGKLNVTDDGTAVFRWITGNYGKALVEDLPGVIAETDSATGRTTLNSSRGALPVAYLTAYTAKESIAGFLVGTDQYAASGTLHLAATPFKP